MKIFNKKGYDNFLDIINFTHKENTLFKSKKKIPKSYTERTKQFLTNREIKDSNDYTLEFHLDINIEENLIRKLNSCANSKYDYEASLIIHNLFNKLTWFEANDKRLWGYLSSCVFLDYVRERWSFDDSSTPKTYIRRFFYEGTGVTTRARNAIARLYWSAEHSYDKNNIDDPYHLTKMFYLNQDITTLFERNIGTYNTLLIEYLFFIERNQDNITSKFAQNLNAGINARGGVQDLSLLSKEDIRDIIKSVCTYNGYDNLSF